MDTQDGHARREMEGRKEDASSDVALRLIPSARWRPTKEIAYYFVFGFIISAATTAHAARNLISGAASATCLLLFLVNLATTALNVHLLRHRRATPSAQSDWLLLHLSLVVPPANLLRVLLWGGHTNWSHFFALQMATGALLDLSVAHSAVQWLISGPLFVLIGFFSSCDTQGQACTAPDSATSLGWYLATQGLSIMAAGLISAATTHFVLKKQRQGHKPSQAQAQQPDQAAPCLLPFESFGVTFVSALGLAPLLQRLEPWLDCKVASLSEALVVELACGPVAIYYLLVLLWGRWNPETLHQVTADEWLLVMCILFLMGRESSHTDLAQLMHQVQAQLQDTHHPGQGTTSSLTAQVSNIFMSMSGGLQALGHQMMERVAEVDKIELLHLLGQGAMGSVFLGQWHGSKVAVKRVVLPATMSDSERSHKMAVAEAAISSSLSHPHVVQHYMFSLHPMVVEDTNMAEGANGHVIALDQHVPGTIEREFRVNAFKLRLVMEYCDRGSLRTLLSKGGFVEDEHLDYAKVLDTAADIAKGMIHLHSNRIVHADLKAANVMLTSGGDDGRGFVAKVTDFGFSFKLDPSATHEMGMFQGTLTHMAPESLMEGKLSQAGDVYAFGITLWELFTGGRPYALVPRPTMGHLIVFEHKRPAFPPHTPPEYRLLAEKCWQPCAERRPTFEVVVKELLALRAQVASEAQKGMEGTAVGVATEADGTAGRRWLALAGVGAKAGDAVAKVGGPMNLDTCVFAPGTAHSSGQMGSRGTGDATATGFSTCEEEEPSGILADVEALGLVSPMYMSCGENRKGSSELATVAFLTT